MTSSLALLDLDGTISDNSTGIVRGTQVGLDAVGVFDVAESTITTLIGPPLRSMFAALGVDDTAIETAVGAYRDYYRDVGVLENELYDGVVDAIDELIDGGWQLAVATSKPEPFAVQILGHFGLASRFEVIAGASLDATREAKADVIGHCLDTLRRRPGARSSIVMIGDRSHDITGAHLAGVERTVGVLWGFGSRAELDEAGASAIIEDPHQLRDAVTTLTA